MLEVIEKFLLRLNPDIITQAPSRINIINPLDAVEGDFWMPSVAINGLKDPLSVFFYVKNIEGESRLKVYTVKKRVGQYSFELKSEEVLQKTKKNIETKLEGPNKLIYASIHRFYQMNSHFKASFLNTDIEIGMLTTIPEKSGLGGSAAIIIAVLFGLAQFFDIYNNYNLIQKKRISNK